MSSPVPASAPKRSAIGCSSAAACVASGQTAGPAAGAHSADAPRLANRAGSNALVPGLRSLSRLASPSDMGKEEVETFLTHLTAERQGSSRRFQPFSIFTGKCGKSNCPLWQR